MENQKMISREQVVEAYKALKGKGVNPNADFDNEDVKKAEALYQDYFSSLPTDLSDKEALELNQKSSYDLILIDAGFGDEDSYEAVLDFLEQDLESAKEMADKDLIQQIKDKIDWVKSEAGAEDPKKV